MKSDPNPICPICKAKTCATGKKKCEDCLGDAKARAQNTYKGRVDKQVDAGTDIVDVMVRKRLTRMTRRPAK